MAGSYSLHDMATIVRGHHVYKDIQTPDIGETLPAGAEDSNDHDKYAVAVMKDRTVVGHVPHSISRICWFFLKLGGSTGYGGVNTIWR